jgi:hypothetical protein
VKHPYILPDEVVITGSSKIAEMISISKRAVWGWINFRSQTQKRDRMTGVITEKDSDPKVRIFSEYVEFSGA